MTNAEKYPNIAELAHLIWKTGNADKLIYILKKQLIQKNLSEKDSV